MKIKMKKIHYLILIIVLASTILFGIVVNTIFLYSDTSKTIQQYLYDTNSNVAKNISNQVNSRMESIEDFANSLTRMPESVVTDSLLEQKIVSFDLDSIAIYDIGSHQLTHYIGQEKTIENDMRDHMNQLIDKPKISIAEDKELYFSAPVKESQKVEKILIGSKNISEVQGYYSKNTVTLLVDTNSDKVIVEKKGIDSSIDADCIENVLNNYKKTSYKGLYRDHIYFAVTNMVEGTTFASISMMSFDDWMPMFLMYILGYGCLIILVLIALVFCVFQFKKETKKYEEIFLTDPLTGGLNRHGFISRMEEIVEKYNYKNYYVLCVDISEFRHINESWGDKAGDRTLLFVYRKIREMIHWRKELVCRSNTDRFLLLLHANSEVEVDQRIEKLITGINEYIHRQFLEYNIQFTVGVCQLSLAENMTSAMNNAVFVSRNAKVKDKCEFYSQEMIEKKQTNAELNNIFYTSLKNHDFAIYLQPKVSQDGKCYAEALVRWIHPEKGVIAPNQFIPLFEQNGKILDLDLYVFEEVCALISKWMSEYNDVLSISVNISRYSIMNAGENIYLRYKKIKDQYGIPDGLIEMELTETVLLRGNQIGFVKKIVDDFKSCGMKVALDDFGFAYSSLGVLKSLDVDTIKLDQSFLKDTTIKSEKIIKSVIRLAHSLGMVVVAEGVEDKAQVDMLYQSGCDYIQGYYYSKPLSIEEFTKWRCQYKESKK